MKKIVIITTILAVISIGLVVFKLTSLDFNKLNNKALDIQKIDKEIFDITKQLEEQTTKEKELKEKNDEQIVVFEVWEKELKRLIENL